LARSLRGELLLAWFSGDDEGGDGVAIVVARLPPRQWQWEEAVVASVERGRSAQNPVLFWESASEEVVLLHTTQRAYEGQATSEVRRVSSRDKGQTWGEASTLFAEAGAFLRNQVALSGDGSELLLPMYYTPRGFFHHASQYSSLRRSKDGVTWEETVMEGTKGRCVQPTLVRIDARHLQAFFRSRAADRIYLSESTDDGRSWSRPRPLELPNNNSGIQALRLQSGNTAIVFNNLEGDYARWPLSIALSDDDAATFAWVRDLEPAGVGEDKGIPPHALGDRGDDFGDDFGDDEAAMMRAEMGEYSYPSLTQSPDGRIHISYTFRRETIKYVSITEEWIKESKRSRGDFSPAGEAPRAE